jgi:chromosome segregation protein
MKLAYVDLCGFRGYRKPLRIDFPDGFTVIDGRNGVGKSTIFDAIEFALTGTIAKYGDAKADGETIADYIWWTGEGQAPPDRYVEVGFRDGEVTLPLRRTQLSNAEPGAYRAVSEGLCDTATMPKSSLAQLCAASIIRDEHIAALSLDLTETDRYTLLRGAIGATDAEEWIGRGSRLVSAAGRRTTTAEKEVDAAARELEAAARRIDEIRAGLVDEALVLGAVARLSSLTGSAAPPDQLAEPARATIAEKSRQVEELAALQGAWHVADRAKVRIAELRPVLAAALGVKLEVDAALAAITAEREPEISSDALTRQARDLAVLVTLGRRLGMHEGHCPLCDSDLTQIAFENGIATAERHARQLNEQAVEQVARERSRKAAEDAAVAAQERVDQQQRLLLASQETVRQFEQRLSAAGLPPDVVIDQLLERLQALSAELERAREDLRVVETLKLNAALVRARRAEVEAKGAHSRAEQKLGLARRAETRAQALHTAARRAASETLDRRLERVLPLMAELYRRLRPHPIWEDIEYKIRGDVRRFLKLQVGDELNPQFMFSSGQRRATGLAFLLSVNLSLAWSRWRSILLDDPVQHIDDFRSVQLAEVMAQLSAAGRQIICAVEDGALADLLCRRLPIGSVGQAKRVTLGPDHEGALTKLRDYDLTPLPQHALVTAPQRLAG